jgi:pyrroline-5-carboxylate reductase
MAGYVIGIIGGGSMGGAVARGLVASGAYQGSQVLVCDHHPEKLQALAADAGVRCFEAAEELLDERLDAVILAIKPQVMVPFLDAHAETLSKALVISIAAGVPIATYEELMPTARVIRVMPNLPISVRSGASAVAVGTKATKDDVALALDVFGQLGSVQVMREDQVDVCGQSVGCAPALFALMIDTLTRAAVRRGMPAAAARAMFESTMVGTARMLIDSGEHPRAYMESVTSPGGTTIQFLKELEPRLAEGCEEGIDAALARNDELSGR